MVFHRSLSEKKYLHLSRTLLSILADLNNTAVCMVSIFLRFPTFTASLSSLFGAVLSSPIAINITITFIVHSIFILLSL